MRVEVELELELELEESEDSLSEPERVCFGGLGLVVALGVLPCCCLVLLAWDEDEPFWVTVDVLEWEVEHCLAADDHLV